jgi:hypothetical protein
MHCPPVSDRVRFAQIDKQAFECARCMVAGAVREAQGGELGQVSINGPIHFCFSLSPFPEDGSERSLHADP